MKPKSPQVPRFNDTTVILDRYMNMSEVQPRAKTIESKKRQALN